MRLKPLSPIRTPSSETLDDTIVRRRGGELVQIPRAIPWQDAYRRLARHWRIGQHMALVAMTRSGKTTFAREVLDLRDWVVVFGTKPKDTELYQGFQRKGYVLRDEWSPEDLSNNRVIFRPPGGLLDVSRQKEAFSRALELIYETGGWTVYIDEVLVLSIDLGLERLLNRMYTQAASNDVTMVAGTQRPRGAPRNMFVQSEWFGLWRTADQDDREYAASFVGDARSTALETMRVLPRYEVLIVDKIEAELMRTKVHT